MEAVLFHAHHTAANNAGNIRHQILVPFHAVETYRGSEDTATLILIIDKG
jgi:hypothetical protein